MSTREDIASNLVTVIGNISSPEVKKVTRQPFELDELSQQQYPAVLIQTIEETKEDLTTKFPILMLLRIKKLVSIGFLIILILKLVFITEKKS